MKEHAMTAIEANVGPYVSLQNNRTEGFAMGVILDTSTKGMPQVPDGFFVVKDNQILHATFGISLWAVTGKTLRGVIIKDNAITMVRHDHYPPGWLGIYLHSSAGDESEGDYENIEILNNTISFEQVHAGTVYSCGIELASPNRVRGVVVKDNTILASPATGIRVGYGEKRSSNCQNIRVEHNTIVDAGWDKKATSEKRFRTAILLDTVHLTDVHVDNNIIKDMGTSKSPRGYHAVWAHPGAGSKSVTFRDNRITPPGALRHDLDRAIVSDAGTGK
jgi:hypothetical protein